MKALLSSIGNRGDVQPLVALGLELRSQGHRAVLCVPPSSREQVESFGLACGPAREELSVGTLGAALQESLRPEVAQHAQGFASRINPDGTRKAEALLEALCRPGA
jgi:vancomycin aglycone glucosyltransferase